MKIPLTFALVLLFVGTSARAQATLTVPGSHATIQAAINAASTGDTILVAAGLYAERIDYLGKGLSIVGAGVGQSILDGQMQGSVVTIGNSEPLGTRIEGFTIRNGLGSLFQLDPASNPLSLGGGIAVVGYSPIPQPLPNLEVKNCRIENCALQGSVLYGGGGGIGVHRAMKVSVEDTEIRNNLGEGIHGNLVVDLRVSRSVVESNVGSGVRVWSSSRLTMTQCRLAGNSSGDGAGLYLSDGFPYSHTVTGCEIVDNVVTTGTGSPSGGGGGIYLSGTTTRVENCLIARNSGPFLGGGIYQTGVSPGGPNEFDLVGNTIVDNGAVLGGGICTGIGLRLANSIVRDNLGSEDIYAFNSFNNAVLVSLKNSNFDPARLKVNTAANLVLAGNIDLPANFVDPVNGDYHLRLDSPCIDAGDQTLANLPGLDIDGEARVVLGDTDMGADEVHDIALHPAAAGRVGVGAGGPFAILSVNGSTGGLDRRVLAPVGSAAVVTMAQPPQLSGPRSFAIFALLDRPRLSYVINVPLGIGDMAFAPCPMITLLFPYLFTFTNNFGPDPCGEFVPSTPTPWSSPPGPAIPFPLTISLQGVIEEAPGVYVPTNLVTYEVR